METEMGTKITKATDNREEYCQEYLMKETAACAAVSLIVRLAAHVSQFNTPHLSLSTHHPEAVQ